MRHLHEADGSNVGSDNVSDTEGVLKEVQANTAQDIEYIVDKEAAFPKDD